jgi:hypothetical protein
MLFILDLDYIKTQKELPMKIIKFAVAIALFVTSVTIDQQLKMNEDGALVSSWSVGLEVSSSQAAVMEEAAMY